MEKCCLCNKDCPDSQRVKDVHITVHKSCFYKTALAARPKDQSTRE